MNKPKNPKAFYYISYTIFILLLIFGIKDIYLNNVLEGLISIIIAIGTGFSIADFDYPKAPIWQKAISIFLVLSLVVAVGYLIFGPK